MFRFDPFFPFQRRTIWIADAHRDEGKRFVVRADEKLTAFLEAESAIRVGRIVLTSRRDFFKLGGAKPILNQAEDLPPR
jgi:hypothetical protein